MDITLTIIGIITGAFITISINALVLSFFFGKRSKDIDNHKERLDKDDIRQDKFETGLNELSGLLIGIRQDVAAIRSSPIFVDGTINRLIAVCEERPQLMAQMNEHEKKIATLVAEVRMHLDNQNK